MSPILFPFVVNFLATCLGGAYVKGRDMQRFRGTLIGLFKYGWFLQRALLTKWGIFVGKGGNAAGSHHVVKRSRTPKGGKNYAQTADQSGLLFRSKQSQGTRRT